MANCERLLFQRPDDAIHRGVDGRPRPTSPSPDTFLSNFEPLTVEQARAIVDHVAEFDRYTEPMKRLLADFVDDPERRLRGFVGPSATGGRQAIQESALSAEAAGPGAIRGTRYLAEIGARLDRGIPAGEPVYFPVNAVLPGRRNNPPDPKLGLPPLAVYSPIHYQELPELFMEFICSLTGKSPSTTGFGSEGALTKGPFNALWPVVDLNNALGLDDPDRLRRPSRRRRATSVRTSGSITTSACSFRRSGAA